MIEPLDNTKEPAALFRLSVPPKGTVATTVVVVGPVFSTPEKVPCTSVTVLELEGLMVDATVPAPFRVSVALETMVPANVWPVPGASVRSVLAVMVLVHEPELSVIVSGSVTEMGPLTAGPLITRATALKESKKMSELMGCEPVRDNRPPAATFRVPAMGTALVTTKLKTPVLIVPKNVPAVMSIVVAVVAVIAVVTVPPPLIITGAPALIVPVRDKQS